MKNRLDHTLKPLIKGKKTSSYNKKESLCNFIKNQDNDILKVSNDNKTVNDNSSIIVYSQTIIYNNYSQTHITTTTEESEMKLSGNIEDSFE